MNPAHLERARLLAWVAFAIYLAALAVAAALRVQGDFAVYYRAGQRILAGLPLYPPDDADKFLYAPVFAVGFAPFALLPRWLAQLGFFALNAWGLTTLLLGSSIMLFGRERQLSALLIVGPVLLACIFINNNVDHGQINLIVLALCVWAIIWARENQPAWSGVSLAAAALIKPFAILAALYLLVRRRFAALGFAVVAGVVLLAAPVVVLGPHGLAVQSTAYVRSVVSMGDRYRVMMTNQSAVALVARLAALQWGAGAASGRLSLAVGMGLEVVLVAATLLTTVRTRAKSRDAGAPAASPALDRFALAQLFALMASFAPISWKSYFAALLVPYMLLLAELWEDAAHGGAALRWTAWLLLGLSVALNFAPGRRVNRILLYYSATFWSSLCVYFAVVAVSSEGRLAAASGQSRATAISGDSG